MRKLLAASATTIALLMTTGTAGAIINGTPDSDNAYVGRMTGADPGGTQRACSGSVIADGVFLTAGHCAVLTGVELHFGDDLAIDETTFDATAVLQHPSYSTSMGKSYDVGIVLFDQVDELGAPVDLGPLGVLPSVNLIDGFTKAELKSFTFETVGYGLVRENANGNSVPLEEGDARLIASQTYLNDHNQYLTLSIHDNKGNGGGCFGDSGGPHLLDDVIVSVTSAGDGNCVATDATQRIDQPEILDWILTFVGS